MKAECHSADTGAGKFPLVSMGGRAEGLVCADPEARTPIVASGNFEVVFHLPNYLLFMAELCQGQVKLVPAKLDVTRKEIRN